TKRFQVAALPLGVQRIEGEGTLAGAAGTGDDGQATVGEIGVHVAQVVRARPADSNPSAGLGHGDFLDGPANSGQSCPAARDFTKSGNVRLKTPATLPGVLLLVIASVAGAVRNFSRMRSNRPDDRRWCALARCARAD